jgi:multidrug efflux pump subunit AcrA (membrane-fusion protein)
MMAEIAVHESSVDKIKPGQKATIVMDAFPDQTFNGEVNKFASLPDQQRNWLSPDIKVYTTEVDIDGTHDFLKPGMSARVEILVDYIPDVLIVPVQVVANRSGKKVCFVVNGGKIKEREVKTGQFNDISVEILEGLKEGEEVLLNPPRITETKTEPNHTTDKFQKPQAQDKQPTKNEPAENHTEIRDPNRAGLKLPDPNHMNVQTREKSDGTTPRQNP